MSLENREWSKREGLNNTSKRVMMMSYLRLGLSSAEERRLLTSCSTMTGRSAGSDRRSSKEISTCVHKRITIR
jgi:hypothetical protein